MVKKIGIILFFVAVAPPLAGQGLPLFSGTAFADSYTQDGKPCPPECVSDSMEIVTWYPSPYNEYEELRLYPVQRDNTYCTDDKKGLMYYDDNNTTMDASDDKVRVCMGSSAWTGGGWQDLGHWQYISGTTDIAPSNSGVVKIQNLKIDQTTQDGYVLTSDANGNASWKTAGSGTRYQIFTSPGTYYFTVQNGVNMVSVTMIGGGGGGGGGGQYDWCSSARGGGGGGSGEYKIHFPVTVTPNTSYTISVASGGAGGDGGTLAGSINGRAGGESSFASLLSANGGGGGTSSGSGGTGGSGGNSGIGGFKGTDGANFSGGSGGSGANSFYGSGGGGGTVRGVGSGDSGLSGQAYGSGGGGAGAGCNMNTGGNGGSGKGGMVLIEW